MPRPKIELPSVHDVYDSLVHIQKRCVDWGLMAQEADDPEELSVDVRLRVLPDDWDVLWGDPSYDTSHRGYWGGSAIAKDSDDNFLRCTAEELLDQVKEDIALRGDE